MKYINFLSGLMLFALIVLPSCDKLETFYEGEAFVYFTSTSAGIPESIGGGASTYTLNFVRGGTGDLSQDVTVNYTIDATFNEGGGDASSAISVVGGENGTVTIPSGQATGSIEITPVDNFDLDGAKTVVVSISDAGNFAIGYPGPDQNNSSFTLTVSDDDFFCPQNTFANFVSTETDLGYSSNTVQITLEDGPGPDCLVFDIVGAGGSIFGTTNTRLNGFVLIEDAPGSSTGTIQDGNFQMFTATGAGPYTNGGRIINFEMTNGTYDLDAGTFQMDYELYYGTDFQFPGTLIYDNR